MLRIAKSLPFFATQDENSPQSYICPSNGFYISVPTRHGLDNYHGPGMVFQGQLNLQLVKAIPSPCLLRVVFTCHSTIPDSTPASPTSESSHTSHSSSIVKGQNVFEVEHILVQDQTLQIKRHTFMFNIKFPRVNFPASMTDGDRALLYSIHSELTFDLTPGDPASETSLLSPSVQLKYLPLVPTCIPQFPVIEMAQVTEPVTNKVLVKASLESPQRGVCPGESLPLSLTITNSSDSDLTTIHASLVRVITYPSTHCSPTGTPPLDPEPVTVHSITLPIAQTINKNTNWMESIEFNVPSNLGLIPTTNKVITPLYKVDYYLSVSVPIASRSSGLASWFTPAVKAPPPVDISLIRGSTGTSGSTGPGAESEQLPSQLRLGSRKTSIEKGIKVNLHMDRITNLNSSMKWPSLIQLPLIPVIIGTVPYHITEKQLRWPIPSYLDVMDRPRFVRDRFEEEMMQHLESLETLIVAGEEDEREIDEIIQAARKSASSGESDEEEQRANARIPMRFRNGSQPRQREPSLPSMGLDTPPPSPPTRSSMDSAHGRPGAHTLPRAGRRSMSPKASGLGKGLLLEMHQSKVQQQMQSELAGI
ncbi:hypothetical protein BGZ96_003908 [Linnemannia gamsii]|uniref:Arrestin C-terminal-like domain-containing protein n=1 Tax=Linnemannia gamsii TaxID=64522 RepID=A0ABQ7KG50_9FUNG|nr:hypothetical protein BGZ96_003908 [Linnemannia gamsii]